jgi:6,7-dimethyl-8-ribityllumazine synthase
VALSELTPVIFGVLTTNTQRQAIERLGGAHGHAGVRAGEAAVEMISLMARVDARKGAGAGGGDAVRRTRRA